MLHSTLFYYTSAFTKPNLRISKDPGSFQGLSRPWKWNRTFQNFTGLAVTLYELPSAGWCLIGALSTVTAGHAEYSVISRWGYPWRITGCTVVPHPFPLCSVLNKGELVQSFRGGCPSCRQPAGISRWISSFPWPDHSDSQTGEVASLPLRQFSDASTPTLHTNVGNKVELCILPAHSVQQWRALTSSSGSRDSRISPST